MFGNLSGRAAVEGPGPIALSRPLRKKAQTSSFLVTLLSLQNLADGLDFGPKKGEREGWDQDIPVLARP